MMYHIVYISVCIYVYIIIYRTECSPMATKEQRFASELTVYAPHGMMRLYPLWDFHTCDNLRKDLVHDLQLRVYSYFHIT